MLYYGRKLDDVYLCVQSCEELIIDSSIKTQFKCSTFMMIIEDVIRSNTPFRLSQAYKSTHQYKYKFLPWWNCECDKLAKLRKTVTDILNIFV